MKRFLILCAVPIAVIAAPACSDDHDHGDHDHSGTGGGAHTSPYPSCNEITQACHSVDVEEGPIHDCHDLGHAAKSDADCAPKKEECLKICRAAAADGGGGGHGDGGGGGDGGGEGGHNHGG